MKALFDFSFTKFVTPSIIKIIYILMLVLLIIGYISFVVIAFNDSALFGILTLLILGPLFVLIYLALIRAGLESLIAQIRTAQNTAELVRLSGGNAPGTESTFPDPISPNDPRPSGPQNPFLG